MRDAFNNLLKPGDWVHAMVGGNWIFGNISEIKEGGLSIVEKVVPGQASPQTPDQLVLQVPCAFGPHGANHMGIFRIDAKNRIEEMMAKQTKQ